MGTANSQSVLVCVVLVCVTCDVSEVCGFSRYKAFHGCSKCLITFPTENFGERQITQDSHMQTGSHELWKFTSFLYIGIERPIHIMWTKEALRGTEAVNSLFC